MKKKIVLGIGTFKRNELLKKALNGVLKMHLLEDINLEVIVVDNSLDNGANCVIEEYKNTRFKIHYFSEIKKSIAAVRNKALKEAINLNADYIAFMDDDAVPEEDWIYNLYNALLKYNADVVTGWQGSIIDNIIQPIPKRILKRKTGEKRTFCCTNNVLFKSEIITKSNLWFDESYGLMTGEDVDFFERAFKSGYKIIWCENAYVYETQTADRLNFEFWIDREYNNGYMSVFKARKHNSLNENKIYKQALANLFLYSLIAFLSIIFRNKKENKNIIKIFRNVGKLNSLYSKKAYQHYKRDNEG